MDEYGAYDYDGYSTEAYETGTYANFDPTGSAYDTGITYETHETHNAHVTHGTYVAYPGYDNAAYPTFAAYDTEGHCSGGHGLESYDDGAYGVAAYAFDAQADGDFPAVAPDTVPEAEAGPQPEPQRSPAARRSSRRRRAAKRSQRSAMLAIGVPSMAVMGVTAAAVSSVAAGHGRDTASAQPAPAAAKAPATKLDQQLSDVSRNADDFADRASRAQQRIGLQKRQAEEAKRKAAEAAHREAMRPKFVLPVTEKGLSAYFGQAGINWMSVHTGIDFPVSEGTPVMAATDGTIRTKWNPSYGNMAIVTAPDGTETWYCHLSSTRIRTGPVQAGTVIAYSGNTGNTTGPHLHFEVRPGGSEPVDPLPWLLSHDLDPR